MTKVETQYLTIQNENLLKNDKRFKDVIESYEFRDGSVEVKLFGSDKLVKYTTEFVQDLRAIIGIDPETELLRILKEEAGIK